MLSHFETTSEAVALEVADDHALVKITPRSSRPRHAHLCEMTKGILASVPVLFGMPTALLTEHECSARGGRACLYALSWDDRSSGEPGVTRARTDDRQGWASAAPPTVESATPAAPEPRENGKSEHGLPEEAAEAERVEAERVEAERVEAERVEAEPVVADRDERAERVETEPVVAERDERVETEPAETNVAEPVETDEIKAAETYEIETVETNVAEPVETDEIEAERVETDELVVPKMSAQRVETAEAPPAEHAVEASHPAEDEVAADEPDEASHPAEDDVTADEPDEPVETIMAPEAVEPHEPSDAAEDEVTAVEPDEPVTTQSGADDEFAAAQEWVVRDIRDQQMRAEQALAQQALGQQTIARLEAEVRQLRILLDGALTTTPEIARRRRGVPALADRRPRRRGDYVRQLPLDGAGRVGRADPAPPPRTRPRPGTGTRRRALA